MKKHVLLLTLLVVVAGSSLWAQKKALNLDDYDRWNRIVSTALSDNGQWMTYGLRPNGGDDTLKVQHLDQPEKMYSISYAANPAFSDNSEWVAYLISPNEKETKKLRSGRKPIFQTAELRHLESGKTWQFERANSMAFSNDSKYFAVHKKKPEEDKSKHQGSDLILVDLDQQSSMNLGNVSGYAFNKKATHLAYTVDAADQAGNGVYVLDLKTGAIQPLDTDAKTYSQLTWDDADSRRSEWPARGRGLAVLKGHEPDTVLHRVNTLLVFTGPGTDAMQTTSLTEGLPEGMVISEQGDLHWTADGQHVLFGFDEQEPKVKLDKDTLPNVDVFHWKDPRINTVQQRQAGRDRRYTYLAALHLADGSFTRLADEDLRELLDSRHSRYRVGRNEKPYIADVNWGVSPADLYRVDLASGARKRFAREVNRPLGYSPDGKYYLFQLDGDLHVYDLEKDALTNITKDLEVSFVDVDHPYPHEKPPYGLAGWTADGKGVILNHKYDLWYVSLDGKQGRNITREVGDKEEIRFRYVNLDPDMEYIDTAEPMLLSAYGECTKKAGFYRLEMGKRPAELTYEDVSYGRPRKARLADRVVVTRETFVDFPDYYLTVTGFWDFRRLTNANPQQAEYAWGSKVLIDYTNSKGEKLQGTLTLPPDYEPGKRYPMVVYFYEKMSNRHHSYTMPVYDDRPHASTYASNGYLFFMPDNVYEEGRPGTSALDCITSAVQKVIDLGYADPERIGLQGHSWGGYQSSFILTQTDMFACVVTGAPPTDLESFYNNIYGSSGTNHTGIMEIGQVRMGRGVTPWTHREIYQRENPMFHAAKISTPFMILHGTADGAVDWTQGLEFYNAARRLGKEVIFLSYPNEPHHLRNEANQKDFQTRMKQYFDHYLMDKPAPQWMQEGIPHLEKIYDKAN